MFFKGDEPPVKRSLDVVQYIITNTVGVFVKMVLYNFYSCVVMWFGGSTTEERPFDFIAWESNASCHFSYRIRRKDPCVFGLPMEEYRWKTQEFFILIWVLLWV